MKDQLLNKEFERAYLGACFVDSEVFASTTLQANDFGFVTNQIIFSAILDVYEETRTTDILLVAEKIKNDGEIGRIGDVFTLHEMQAVIVETESASYYAKEIKRLSYKRKMAAIMQSLLSKLHDPDVDPESITAEFEMKTAHMEFEQDQLESYTTLELSNMEIEEVKWFIPEFLPSGLTILAGPPKIGKSFFCWNIALSVATGGIAFSSIDVEESRTVSYLTLEDPPGLLKDRLDLMSPDFKPTNIHIVPDFHQKKLDAVGLKLIEKHLDETDTELLIIDTWQHVCPIIDKKGTSYEIDYEALIPIQKFAHRRNMGIILVTHTRKAIDVDNVFNQIQGSVGMQASCDTLMMLSHSGNSKSLHLSGRRIRQEEYALTINDGIWQLEGSAEEFNKSELRIEIFGLLREAGEEGLKAVEITELTGKRDDLIRQTLRRMVKDGDIGQTKPRGEYIYPDKNKIKF